MALAPGKVCAKCRAWGKSRIGHTYVVLRMRRVMWHMHDVYANSVHMQSSEVARGQMVRVRA